VRIRVSILLFVLYALAHAQKLPFDNYTTLKEGLPSNVVLDIVEDHKGYMWFATQVGLTRFDGYHFETYTIEDGLPDNYIRTLFVDSKGNLWAGTQSGFVIKYDGYRFNHFSDSIFQHSDIQEFNEDNDGNIYCLTKKGITKIGTHGKIITYTAEKYFQNNSLFTLFADNKQIWLGTGNGIYIINRDNSIEYFSDEFKNAAVTSIIKTGKNSYCISTQGLGLVFIQNNKIKK
jgi:hypothetical protein